MNEIAHDRAGLMSRPETRALHRELVEGLTDVCFAMDADLRLTFWNKAAEELVGIRAEEALGKSLCDLFPPEAEFVKDAAGAYRRVLMNRTSEGFIIHYPRPEEGLCFGVSVYPNPNGVTVIARDITGRKRAEEALEEEKGRARQYLDIVGTTVVTIDTDQTVSLINRAGCRLLGYSEEEIIGKNWFDHFLPERVREQVRQVFAQLMAGRVEPVEYVENIVLTRGGGERTVAWHNTILRDRMGRITGTLSSGEDITERKRAEAGLKAAYAKLETLWGVASLADADVKTISDHILVSITRMSDSKYGFYGFVNDDESVMTIHAWSGEAMKDCSMVDKPQQFPVCKAGVWGEAIRRREPLILNDYAAAHAGKKGLPEGHVALTNLLAVPFFSHGRITAVAAVANRIADYGQDDVNRITAFLGSVQTIVERRRAEEALIESEHHVRQLNEHIMNMVMVVSHDIRGPLLVITSILKLMLRGTYGKLDPSPANTVKDLLSRCTRLLGTAEDYLGKASIVGGSMKMEREALDLRQDIIDAVLNELADDISKHEIVIDNRLGAIPAGSISISASKTWLKAVFRNLFSNAIKYGGQGCTIAFGFEEHNSHYRFNVYNSGRPISEEDREKLFMRFSRIGALEGRPPDGVGLGLFLTREIVLEHGGEIWYEARPDGSNFVFTISREDAGGT